MRRLDVMMKRLLPLIGIAFVVALISTAAFYSLFAARVGATSSPESRVGLVTAARALAPGTILTKDDLNSLAWSGPEAPPGAFTSVDKVAGHTTAEGIPKGELILASRLVARDGGPGGIPEGMRAVSVHVSDSAGVIGMLKPGHKIDLQAFAWRSQEPRHQAVRTMLRGTPVLSVSREPQISSQGYSAPVITVLVSAAEAEELAFADSFLRLRIALRNPAEPPVQEPPVQEPPVAAPAAKRDPPAKLVMRTFAISSENLSRMMLRLDRDERSGALSIATSDTRYVSPLLSEFQAVLESESTVLAERARLTYLNLPPTEGDSFRIGVGRGSAPGRVRIRPERRNHTGGLPGTRSLESEAMVGTRQCVVISGLGGTRLVTITLADKV